MIIISVTISTDFRGNQGIVNVIRDQDVPLYSKTELRDHHHHHHHAHDFFVIGFWGRATSTVTGRHKHPSQSADDPVSGGGASGARQKGLKGP